jgi:two-component system nitrate/nitrite response regulator NarL
MHRADLGQVRVFVVAEVRLYEQGLAQALDRDGRYVVAGTASSVGEGIARMRELEPSPDVAVVDLAGPGGPAAVSAIRDGVPDLKVIALGIRELESDLLPWAEAGVDGFVSPQATLDDLLSVVDSVARGETLCSPRMTAALLRHVGTLAREQRSPPSTTWSLTARESEIAGLIDEGLSNKEIAQRLCIELPTVKNHVHNLLEKLGVRRRGEAAAAWRGQTSRQRGSGKGRVPGELSRSRSQTRGD